MQGRGTERTVVRLLHHFDRRTVDPSLVLASARGEFLPDIPDDVFIHDLGLTERRTSRAVTLLHRVIRSTAPDCLLGVHTAPSRLLGLLNFLFPTIPLICYETDPFSIVEASKGHAVLRRLVTAASHRRASVVIAASDVVAADLRRLLRLPEQKLIVIPNPCTDAELFKLAKEDVDHPAYRPPGQPVVVNVGNLYPHKAQTVLLQAFAFLLRNVKANLVIIGDGPLRGQLEQLSGKLGIGERVWFLGFQRNPFKYVARSSVFVSSSVAEGFDISQVEAMALGVPVVVTDAPRYRAVEDGKSGLLVPPNRPNELADAIEKVLASDALAARLTEGGHVVASALSADNIARRYERVIREVVDRKHPVGRRTT